MSGESKMNLTGLGKGGQQVQQCRKVRRDGSLPSCNQDTSDANACSVNDTAKGTEAPMPDGLLRTA